MSFHTFHVYCSIWVKFGIRYVKIMLLRICDVFLKPAKESHTVIVIINEITYTRVLWNRMLFEVKNAVLNSVCYVTSTRFAAFFFFDWQKRMLKNKDSVDFGITHFACAGNIIYLSKKHQLSQACRNVSKRSFLAEVLSCISSISPSLLP